MCIYIFLMGYFVCDCNLHCVRCKKMLMGLMRAKAGVKRTDVSLESAVGSPQSAGDCQAGQMLYYEIVIPGLRKPKLG